MQSGKTDRGTWAWGPASLLAVVVLVAGCEPDVSVPAGPSGTGVVPTAPAKQAVPTVGLVVPEEGNLAAAAFERTVRNEAASAEALVDGEKSRPGKQAEAIRELARQGITSLIVVPAPGEEISSALSEVRADGIPVIFLNRPGPEGIKSPRVMYTPYEQTARELVEGAVASARQAGFPPEAPAAILVNGPYDDNGREMLAALHLALDEAKVPTLPDITFRGYQKEAKEAFSAFLQQHPDVGMVFAIEDQAIKAAATTRDKLDHEPRRFVMAGFAFEYDTIRMTNFNVPATLAEVRVEALATRALHAALELAEGQSLPETIVVETRLYRPSGPEREGYFPRFAPGPETEAFGQEPVR